jgi:hypothetical protein
VTALLSAAFYRDAPFAGESIKEKSASSQALLHNGLYLTQDRSEAGFQDYRAILSETGYVSKHL